jgi:Domain of unknown function (DUF1877)
MGPWALLRLEARCRRSSVACRGVLYAIGADAARTLLEVAAKATSEDEVVDAAEEHDRDEASWRYLDKAWDGIACCLIHLADQLQDGALAPDSDRCVFGGWPLTDGEDWIVTLWEPAEVRASVAILEGITEASLRRAYGALDAEETKEYPEHGDEEDFQYVWAYFQDARELCVRAAGAGQAMLFIADQ